MNWRYKIELNKVLADMGDQFDLSCVEKRCPKAVKEALAKEVEKAAPLRRFASTILSAKSIAEVERILENVFNEADRSAVWCGFSG